MRHYTAVTIAFAPSIFVGSVVIEILKDIKKTSDCLVLCIILFLKEKKKSNLLKIYSKPLPELRHVGRHLESTNSRQIRQLTRRKPVLPVDNPRSGLRDFGPW